MSRLARIVVPHWPHHVTQRGNRREPIFFEDGDQEVYCDLLAEQTAKARVEVWAYCLMPNHVHLILTPGDAAGLGRAVGETHRRYTNFINARGRWSGHLFQRRFASVAMDDAHLITGVRYVSLNPVRARLVAQAEDWPWSSVRAHLAGQDDGLVSVKPVLDPSAISLRSLARLLQTQMTSLPSATLKDRGALLPIQSSSRDSKRFWAAPSRGAHPVGRNASHLSRRTNCHWGNRYGVAVFRESRIPRSGGAGVSRGGGPTFIENPLQL